MTEFIIKKIKKLRNINKKTTKAKIYNYKINPKKIRKINKKQVKSGDNRLIPPLF